MKYMIVIMIVPSISKVNKLRNSFQTKINNNCIINYKTPRPTPYQFYVLALPRPDPTRKFRGGSGRGPSKLREKSKQSQGK